MMHIGTAMMLTFVLQGMAKVTNNNDDVQESENTSVDNLLDHLVSKLFNRVVKTSVQRADLDDTTLEKPANLAIRSHSSLRPLVVQPPTQRLHYQSGSCSCSASSGTHPAWAGFRVGHQTQFRNVQTAAEPTATKVDLGDVPTAATKRVVITGLGLVTPLGYDVDSTWEALLAGKTGIKKITDPVFEGLPTQIAAYIKQGTEEGDFDGNAILGKKLVKQMSPFQQYVWAASKEAMKDSGWKPETEEDMVRTGVAIGSGIGGIDEITKENDVRNTKGYRRISPRFLCRELINLASGFVSMEHNAKGPNTAAATACATGAHMIGDAYRFIKFGEADVMIAGGAEAAVEPLSIAGFNQMKALATNRNDEPEKSSRPFDEDRSGFVMGEGAGVLILEELEHAKKRGAKIYAELRGVGYTGDAFHVSAPSGEGGQRAMKEALRQAGLEAKDIAYINAHGTSTPVGDKMELEGIQTVFGGPSNTINPVVTSTKGATGHALGAAGAIEAVFTTLAVAQDTIPQTLNLEKPILTEGIKHVVGEPLKTKVDAALSNSFGFGGTNACLCFSKAPPS